MKSTVQATVRRMLRPWNPAAGGTNGPCSSDPAVIKLLSSTPLGFIKEQLHAGVQYQFGLSSGSTLTPRFDAAYQGPQPGSNLAPAPAPPLAGAVTEKKSF